MQKRTSTIKKKYYKTLNYILTAYNRKLQLYFFTESYNYTSKNILELGSFKRVPLKISNIPIFLCNMPYQEYRHFLWEQTMMFRRCFP